MGKKLLKWTTLITFIVGGATAVATQLGCDKCGEIFAKVGNTVAEWVTDEEPAAIPAEAPVAQ
jgi:hypothetical protein